MQNTNQNNSNLSAMLGGQQGNMIRPTMNQGGPGPSAVGQMVHGNQGQIVHGNMANQMSHGAGAAGGQMNPGLVTGNQGLGSSGMMQGNMVGGPNRMQQPMMTGAMPNQGEMVNWQTQGKPRRGNEMIMLNVNAKHPNMANMQQMGAQVGGKSGPIQMNMAGQNDQVNQMNMASQISRQNMTMQARVPSPGFSIASGPITHPRQGTPALTNVSTQMQQQQQQLNMQNTMSFISPSSSNVPSTASNSGSIRNMNQLGAPSPSGMINTPGQPPSNNASIEDRAYTEKVKQLQSKYLDTLREVAQRLENSDSENANKVRNLLEVIENPHRRASRGMETLKACEMVLERLGIQQRESRSDAPSTKSQNKDNPVVILFDAINLALKSPFGSHTIYRTLSPALCTLLGPEIDLPISKKTKIDEDTTAVPSELPYISETIQGEVARLPSRFKVNLESQQLDNLILSCQLDDPNLPCVPPIILIIPPSYPNTSPRCRLLPVDYETTDFLKNVYKIMSDRQLHLPEMCSLTMILDAWEMSVRRACSDKPFLPDAVDPLVKLNIIS